MTTKFQTFKDRVTSSPTTLFMMIADECHFDNSHGGAYDKFVNDRDLAAFAGNSSWPCLSTCQRLGPRTLSFDGRHSLFMQVNSPNVVMVLCSATPYCALTEDSYVYPRLHGNPPFELQVVEWQTVLNVAEGQSTKCLLNRVEADKEMRWLERQGCLPNESGARWRGSQTKE